MDSEQARYLMSKMAIWYHHNKIGDTISKKADGSNKQKYSEALWAKLLTEAVISFHNGLEDRIDPPNRRVAKELFDNANNLVGDEAFQTIAMLISAAGAKVAQNYVDPQSFLPAIDLSGYLSTEADRNAYGQFSTWLMQISSQPVTQGTMHQATKYLQDLAKTSGLSDGFAYVLSSMGTEYQQLADQYTRQSGEGQYAGEGELPTGIQIQGSKVTIGKLIVEAVKRVEADMGIE